MIINKTNINKITKAFELICPMFKENLIEEAFIVGSVAKGTAREDSDIDIYLINSKFEKFYHSGLIDLQPGMKMDVSEYPKMIDYLIEISCEPKLIEYKNEQKIYWIYKKEKFHILHDYESESIKKGGEYIEITKELCNEVL